jgi:hypothetical protein
MQDMNNAILLRNIIIISSFFIYICNLNAQKNNLFKEYLSSFTEIHLTDSFQNSNTIDRHSFIPNKFFIFLDKEVYESWASVNSLFICKIGKYYLVLLVYGIEDEYVFEKNAGYYYFIFYDEIGTIINSYKFLYGTDAQWFKNGVNHDSKLFISKDKIKYLLYGPYKGYDMEANCMEVLYEIKDNGSLEKLSEKNYKAKKLDQWNW